LFTHMCVTKQYNLVPA